MFNSIKIYTVHILPNIPRAQQQPVFVREGFNVFAFMFSGLWALTQRLWLATVCIVAFNMLLMAFGTTHILSPIGISIIQLAFQLLVGFHANDLRRAKLAKEGYVLADVTAADSGLRAQQRYFERSLAAA